VTLSLPASAAEPTVESLIAVAPSISSSDSAYESIELAGELSYGPVRMKFHASYQAPDQFALVLRDSMDDTPVVYVAGRKALVYDPILSELLYLSDASVRLTMKFVEDEFQFRFSFFHSKEDASEVAFDIKSLVLNRVPGGEIASLPEGYRLALTTPLGNKTVATVNPAALALYSNVELFSKDEKRPVLSVDTISANHALPSNRFRFPDLTLLAKSLPVRRIPFDGTTPEGEECKELAARALYIRLAINRSELRKQMPEVDWERVAANDKAFSKLLRESLAFETL
jgi:hypothetical protein